MNLSVFAADVGSIAQGNFGWAGQLTGGGNPEGTDIDELWQQVAQALQPGAHVALGFECPLFVPLATQAQMLGRARDGEGSRPWSVNAGCSTMALGLVQLIYVLERIRSRFPDLPAYVSWSQFAQGAGGLLIWEAFVSGPSKSGSHVGDARLAVQAFVRGASTASGPHSKVCSASSLSLAGAALLRAGWNLPAAILEQPCLVVAG
jgi:hypothetical protein